MRGGSRSHEQAAQVGDGALAGARAIPGVLGMPDAKALAVEDERLGRGGWFAVASLGVPPRQGFRLGARSAHVWPVSGLGRLRVGELRDGYEKLRWEVRLFKQRLRAAWKQRGYLPCGNCGGPHRFDTSVPSVVWNDVIRRRGLSEYLCLNCIVREFVRARRSFTATLWGDCLGGFPIEIRIGGKVATDAAAISEENTALRVTIRELSREHGPCPGAAP